VPTSTIPPFLQTGCPSCRPTNGVTTQVDLYNDCKMVVVGCVSDCITDIRQSLAAPRLISKSDAGASSSSSTEPGVSAGLGELLRKMHSSLVSQIKSVLTHLQVRDSPPHSLLMAIFKVNLVSRFALSFWATVCKMV